jgi:hypothetical protein
MALKTERDFLLEASDYAAAQSPQAIQSFAPLMP